MTKKKSKTVKKTKTAKRRTAARSDRCQPLRDQLGRLDEDIANIEESLSDPDIPNDIKERLRVLLRRLLVTRARVLRALEACEAIPDDPRR